MTGGDRGTWSARLRISPCHLVIRARLAACFCVREKMSSFLKTVSTLGILGSLVWCICPPPELRHPPGVRIDAEPVQTDCPPHFLCRIHDYDLTAVAGYELSARV